MIAPSLLPSYMLLVLWSYTGYGQPTSTQVPDATGIVTLTKFMKEVDRTPITTKDEESIPQAALDNTVNVIQAKSDLNDPHTIRLIENQVTHSATPAVDDTLVLNVVSEQEIRVNDIANKNTSLPETVTGIDVSTAGHRETNNEDRESRLGIKLDRANDAKKPTDNTALNVVPNSTFAVINKDILAQPNEDIIKNSPPHGSYVDTFDRTHILPGNVGDFVIQTIADVVGKQTRTEPDTNTLAIGKTTTTSATTKPNTDATHSEGPKYPHNENITPVGSYTGDGQPTSTQVPDATGIVTLTKLMKEVDRTPITTNDAESIPQAALDNTVNVSQAKSDLNGPHAIRLIENQITHAATPPVDDTLVLNVVSAKSNMEQEIRMNAIADTNTSLPETVTGIDVSTAGHRETNNEDRDSRLGIKLDRVNDANKPTDNTALNVVPNSTFPVINKDILTLPNAYNINDSPPHGSYVDTFDGTTSLPGNVGDFGIQTSADVVDKQTWTEPDTNTLTIGKTTTTAATTEPNTDATHSEEPKYPHNEKITLVSDTIIKRYDITDGTVMSNISESSSVAEQKPTHANEGSIVADNDSLNAAKASQVLKGSVVIANVTISTATPSPGLFTGVTPDVGRQNDTAATVQRIDSSVATVHQTNASSVIFKPTTSSPNQVVIKTTDDNTNTSMSKDNINDETDYVPSNDITSTGLVKAGTGIHVVTTAIPTTDVNTCALECDNTCIFGRIKGADGCPTCTCEDYVCQAGTVVSARQALCFPMVNACPGNEICEPIPGSVGGVCCPMTYSDECPPVRAGFQMLCLVQAQYQCRSNSDCGHRRICCPGMCGNTCRHQTKRASRLLSIMGMS